MRSIHDRHLDKVASFLCNCGAVFRCTKPNSHQLSVFIGFGFVFQFDEFVHSSLPTLRLLGEGVLFRRYHVNCRLQVTPRRWIGQMAGEKRVREKVMEDWMILGKKLSNDRRETESLSNPAPRQCKLISPSIGRISASSLATLAFKSAASFTKRSLSSWSFLLTDVNVFTVSTLRSSSACSAADFTWTWEGWRSRYFVDKWW